MQATVGKAIDLRLNSLKVDSMRHLASLTDSPRCLASQLSDSSCKKLKNLSSMVVLSELANTS
jgi:hypothetical protein